MLLRDHKQADHRPLAYGLAVVASFLCCLSLAGCGSGVANLLPDAAKPAAGIPSGPVLGYIFSPTDGTLRALMGVRGSAQVSASIVPSGTYIAGEVSTTGSTALLEDASGSLFAFDLPLSQPIHVADGLPANAHIVFASSGQTAIAYGASGSTIALITGLPATPKVQNISVSSGNAAASAIVSDAGTIVMAAQGSPTAIGTLSAAGQFSRLTTVATLGGFNFLPASDDVLLADSTANTVSLAHNVSSSASLTPLSVTGLNHPLAIAASRDHKWAIVANSGDAALLRIDLATGTPTTKVLCNCQPSQLNTLSGGSAFRVNALYSGPLWTVDLASATPQLLFVPAIAKGTP